MRLLVVGANGLLGSNVVHAAQQREWDVCGTYHSTQPDFPMPLTQFDLQTHEDFEAILTEFTPDVVVNCAAMTDVDACERDPETARILNGTAPASLARQCAARDVAFVHISTDYIFDGASRQPYLETAAPNPIQVYGKSKLTGEQAVREEHPTALVARLSFVWGIHRHHDELTGFPAWVRGQLQEGTEVPLFTDQWLTPTRAGAAATTLLELIERDVSGLFHVACQSCVTPYEFGVEIAEIGGYDTARLTESSLGDVERDARRPGYSCLDVSNIESTLDRPQPTLQADLDAVEAVFNST